MKIMHKKMLSRKEFTWRMIKLFFLSLSFIIFSLLIGIAGYYYYGQLNFVDSLYNASMILTGMGPVDKMPSDAAKYFSSFYALYSGVAFLTTIALFLSPVAHRALLLFHLDTED